MSERAAELVSAGAGTGKTYDIVERIVAAVAGGTPIGRIAAITFTTRAAEELQRRLKVKLAKKGHTQAALEADAAFVSTIHSFCLRLVTEHPVDSGVPPETRPIEERETKTLLERAISEAMEADPEVAEEVRFITRECLRYNNDGSVEDQLRKKILALVDCVRALAKTADDLKPLADRNDADLRSRLPALATQADMQKVLQPLLQKYTAWWAKNGQKMKPTQKMANNARSLEPFLAGGPLTLEHFWNCPLVPGKNPKWAEHDGVLVPLQTAITELLFRHPDWQDWYRRYARALFTLTGAALSHYESMKRTLNVMDFSDMQTAALGLMSRTVEGRPFAEYLRARFDLIVVDEFQDTSPLQFAVIEELRGAIVQGRYVGDLKQAIYGWRDADSRLFQGLIQDAAGNVETLKDNRRSRKRLVEFFNEVCRPLMPTVGLTYDDLVAKSVYVKEKVPAFGDELSILRPGDTKGKTAERLALWVQSLIRDPAQQVWDRDAGRARRLRPGDVAVLVRSNREVQMLTDALGKVGIRSSEAAKGVGQRPEVQLFRALVAAFSNPENRLSMAAVLASEVYGLTHAALHRASKLLQSPRSYYIEEVRTEVEKNLQPEEWSALRRYYEDMGELKPRFRRQPLLEAIDRMIERTRLRDRLAGKTDGKQCLANLDLCRETAATFLTATPRQLSTMGISGDGVEAFLAWFDQRLRPEDEIAQTRPVDEEAVQVMTIHKSKGLEFPVTVLHFMDGGVLPKFDRREMVRPAKAGGREMLEKSWIRSFPGSFRPLPEAPLLGDAAADSRADGVKNLYVGMTRAQERLVLVYPETVEPDTYADLLASAGLKVEGSAVVVGKESFAAKVMTAVNAPPPSPPPSQDHRAAALASPDATAFEVEEIAPRDAGGLTRLSPTLLCLLFDGLTAFYREEICGMEHLGPAERPVTIRVETVPIPGVAGAAPPVKGRTDLGTLLHRALAAELPLPETLKRLEVAGGPAVRGYAERVLDPIRAHLESLAPTGPLLVEHQLFCRLGGSVLSGVLDLAVPTKEGLWIYDLKTNDIKAAEVPLYAQYYAPQLWSYALGAARAGLGKVAGLRLVFTTPGLVATIPSCPAAFEKQVGELMGSVLSGLK